jgi:hypothetical protein
MFLYAAPLSLSLFLECIFAYLAIIIAEASHINNLAVFLLSQLSDNGARQITLKLSQEALLTFSICCGHECAVL